MSYKIHVAQSDISFECPDGSTILDAAKGAGYELPHSCRTGICGSCKDKILSGAVGTTSHTEALSEQEKAAGYTLFCQAKPCSDMEIETRSITRLDPNAHKLVSAKVYKVTRASDDVSMLQLRFPAGNRVKFKAGQYLQVLLADGSRRCYSMANPPHQSDGALLHIRHVPNGRFSAYLAEGIAAGDIVKVEMPFGDFYLREETAKPIIFVASGTGFALIKSILEDIFKKGNPSRAMSLYWGGRKATDLYQLELPIK